MINPFRGAPRHGNPGPPPQIDDHPGLWRAVRDLQIAVARVEERARLNWLLGLAIFAAIMARIMGVSA